MAATELVDLADFPTVPLSLYLDIHKGIRAELFAVTVTAGRVDPACDADLDALAAHVASVAQLLNEHAEHEDAHIDAPLQRISPAFAERVNADHAILDARIDGLRDRAAGLRSAGPSDRRARVHGLYMELASFTSTYLDHQDFEERVVMPAVDAALGFPGVLEVHQAIIAGIPPEEMARSLAIMLPAMNVDDRTDLLGGMKAGAPPEVFEGVWSLATSVLEPRDVAALAGRLGV
jgi:hypothetical protein